MLNLSDQNCCVFSPSDLMFSCFIWCAVPACTGIVAAVLPSCWRDYTNNPNKSGWDCTTSPTELCIIAQWDWATVKTSYTARWNCVLADSHLGGNVSDRLSLSGIDSDRLPHSGMCLTSDRLPFYGVWQTLSWWDCVWYTPTWWDCV